MKCEQVNHCGGGNSGTKGVAYPHEARFPEEPEELPMKEDLSLNASLQIQAAEYWLKLGEADQALRELEALPSRVWNHGWALKARIAAMGVLRGRDEIMGQA
jgi:hypothetical protein